MEDIISLTADKKAAEISDADMKKINDLAIQGVTQWDIIQKSAFDSTLFGFNEAKTVSLKKSIEEGKNMSIKFLSIVESGDK